MGPLRELRVLDLTQARWRMMRLMQTIPARSGSLVRNLWSVGVGAALALQLCMLLSRWIPIHRQLRCALLLRDIHATHACLRKYLDPFQIDPITAKARISSRHPKNNGRKSKKIREGRRKNRKTIIEGRPSTPGKLSSLLRLHDNKSRYPRSEDEGAYGLRSRTFPGRLSRNKSIDGVSPYLYT